MELQHQQLPPKTEIIAASRTTIDMSPEACAKDDKNSNDIVMQMSNTVQLHTEKDLQLRKELVKAYSDLKSSVDLSREKITEPLARIEKQALLTEKELKEFILSTNEEMHQKDKSISSLRNWLISLGIGNGLTLALIFLLWSYRHKS